MKIPTGAAARVARALLEGGPATTSALAKRLDLTSAAIRRQLDQLEADGAVESGERAPYGPAAPRGRGRPARVYSLTSAGRDAFDQAYDDLAVAAMRFLDTSGGESAVRSFAMHRAGELERRHSAVSALPLAERPAALAGALSADGYAATAREAPSGVQICQHHCPVAHVAAEFPQLCDAETEALSRLLGTHVLRLATIANGDGVCTTHIPSAAMTAPGRTTAATVSSTTSAGRTTR